MNGMGTDQAIAARLTYGRPQNHASPGECGTRPGLWRGRVLWEVNVMSCRYPETLGHAILGEEEFIEQGRGEGTADSGSNTVQGTEARNEL